MNKIPPIDKKVSNKLKTATFAMGCFWGPDSLFGAAPGVIRTRVGYSGGKKEDPTYHNLDGHTETIQIDYDQKQISYEQLVKIFWHNHDPTHQNTTQYKAIIFFHDEEQEKIARSSKEKLQEEYSMKIMTELRLFSKFYMAEDYHQKYHLSRNKKIYRAYQQVYPDMAEFIDSTAVARVNGYVSGHGDLKSKEDLKGLGLTDEGKKMLYEKWKSSGGEIICSLD
ncbi:MAG: peptide-methionine (S)-S-oxide reductase MsrA [Candidatus Natronoplasma sp.]